MEKVILHCDLNCFFASVEMLYHPELRNVPMAVVGDPAQRHGIILTKNPLAKKKGVKTAETIREAQKKCPELILRSPDYDSYAYFSDKVKDIYYRYTDCVEPFGIDECWLDISGSIRYFGSVEIIVNGLLNSVKLELGLTLSIGVSFNKVYAKLGSDLAEDDSACYIRGLEDIEHLEADKLLGVGRSTYETLKSYNLYTIGDIAHSDPANLKLFLGKWGEYLYRYANGDSSSDMVFAEESEMKSIGNSCTPFRDLYNIDDVKVILKILSDSVSSRVKKEGLYFRTIKLSVRNNRLETRTMQTTLETNSDLSKDIYDNSLLLFCNSCSFVIPYRSLGISVSKLSSTKDDEQESIFGIKGYSLKQKNEETAIETIRQRFGYSAISTLRIFEESRLANLYPEEKDTDD